MVWFKVDDSLHSHPKARRAGIAAMGLWSLAGAYASQYATDGFVPEWFVASWKGHKHADRLVSAGMWRSGELDGVPGWWFHDWDDYQPSRDEIERDRELNRERQRRLRERRREAKRNAGDAVTNAVTNAVSNGTPARPGPSRPVPSRRTTKNTPSPDASTNDDPPSPTSAAADAASEFERFWELYPRRVGKAAARKAFTKAAGRAGADAVIAGAQRLAADPNLPEAKYIPHPSTWLNRDGWEDDPYPPQIRGPSRRTTSDKVRDGLALAQRLHNEETRAHIEGT